MEKCKNNMGWKPTISAIGGIGWLIFVIYWLAFLSIDMGLDWEKRIAIVLLSILVLFLLLGGMWAFWSLRMMPKEGWEMFKIHGFRWRIITSIAIPLLAMIFLIIWFWYAGPRPWFQSLAAILITLIVMGSILGAIWARWSTKYGKDMEKFEKMGEEFGKKFEEKFEGKDKEEKD